MSLNQVVGLCFKLKKGQDTLVTKGPQEPSSEPDDLASLMIMIFTLIEPGTGSQGLLKTVSVLSLYLGCHCGKVSPERKGVIS